MMMYEREDINEILLNNARAMLHRNEKNNGGENRKLEKEKDILEIMHDPTQCITFLLKEEKELSQDNKARQIECLSKKNNIVSYE